MRRSSSPVRLVALLETFTRAQSPTSSPRRRPGGRGHGGVTFQPVALAMGIDFRVPETRSWSVPPWTRRPVSIEECDPALGILRWIGTLTVQWRGR